MNCLGGGRVLNRLILGWPSRAWRLGKARTLFPRRSRRAVVGPGSTRRTIRSRKLGEAGSNNYRPGNLAGSQHLLPGEQSTSSRFRAGSENSALRGRSRGGGQTLCFARLDRAEVQAGKELPGMGSLPGPQGHLHPKALAVVNQKSLLQRNIQYLQQYDIKDVADGFARNALFPKKLAEPATKESEGRVAKLKQQAEQIGEIAADLLAKNLAVLDGKTITSQALRGKVVGPGAARRGANRGQRQPRG